MADIGGSAGTHIQFQQDHNLSVPKESVTLMRTRDWERIKTQIKGLKETEKGFSAFAYAALGIFISGGLGLLAWLPAARVLPVELKLEFAWITPAFIGASVVGLGIAISCWIAAYVVAKAKETSVDSIVSEMESIIEN
ncbi:hypothetical protein [Glutamicibacter arilaitensis]|uniref:hypothetical protein n=1 Tax=Glutamicibacter arilaitensis TaxID=256701 RepID=UPI00384FD488